jgi:malate dehydrogenase (oxaloacetate-decarboxylating)(NADP+)
VLLWVAPAVAWAAVTSGIAPGAVDVEEYRASLEARLGRARAVMRGLSTRAARDPRRIVFPEGDDARVVRAARILVDENVANPILLGQEQRVREVAQAAGVTLEGVEVRDPLRSSDRETYARSLWTRRQRKGITLSEARARAGEPMYYGCLMLAAGHADALVAGEEMYYADTIRPALETIGVGEARQAVCGIYMMILPKDTYFFADCTVNIAPDATRLADITQATADFVWRLGIEPRVAMLSFSNFGETRHAHSDTVAEAVRVLHERDPNLMVDGEMQVDTAVMDSVLRERYPFSRLRRAANVLIFPDLNAANIAYKLLWRVGGAQAIGPILVGMARPVHILQRDSDVSDIVNIAVIAAVDAQERERQTRTGSP